MYETMLISLIKEKADFVACGIADYCSEGEIEHSMSYKVGSSEEFFRFIYKDTTFLVSAVNKLYKKHCWNNLRFPKGKLCEDAFTTYLLVDQAKKIVQIPDILYHYRIRESSIMTTRFRTARMDEEEAWRHNYQYMREKHPEIAKIAYDFYLQKVNVLFHTIPREQYSQFRKEHDYLYHILCKNLKYVLFRSSLSLKYRIRFLVDILKIKRQEEQV